MKSLYLPRWVKKPPCESMRLKAANPYIFFAPFPAPLPLLWHFSVWPQLLILREALTQNFKNLTHKLKKTNLGVGAGRVPGPRGWGGVRGLGWAFQEAILFLPGIRPAGWADPTRGSPASRGSAGARRHARLAGGAQGVACTHTRVAGRPESQGVPGPARQPPPAPPGHVRASPCVRARRAGGGQSGAAAHLVPGEPLAPASPQTRGPDTQTLIDRRAQPRAARARRRQAAQWECEAAARAGGWARGAASALPPPPFPAAGLPSSSDTSLSPPPSSLR